MLGLWGIAVWVGSSVKYATVFAAILIGSLLVLGALGGILLRALRRVSRHHLIRRSAVLRHGIANLYRPGAHAAAILATLSIGVMVTLSIYFLQNSLLEEVRLTAPPVAGAANAALVELLADTFGIAERSVTIVAGASARTKRRSKRIWRSASRDIVIDPRAIASRLVTGLSPTSTILTRPRAST